MSANMEQSGVDFQRFIDLLCVTAKEVEHRYFQLPRAYSCPAYRERVYGYELYHQLRKAWPDDRNHYLHAEVDKSGQSRFPKSLSKAKPDFLIHDPGNMDRNLVVVEVKSIQNSKAKLKEDIRKLASFCNEAQYQAGVLLVYGCRSTCMPSVEGLIRFARCRFRLGKFYLVMHEAPGEVASVVGTYSPADASPQLSA